MSQVEKLEGVTRQSYWYYKSREIIENESLMFTHGFLPLIVLGSKHKQSRNEEEEKRLRKTGVQKG